MEGNCLLTEISIGSKWSSLMVTLHRLDLVRVLFSYWTKRGNLASQAGFGPTTFSFVAKCSNPLSYWDIWRRRWVLIPRYSHWQCDALPLSYVSIYGADEGSRYPTIGLEDRYTSFIRHLHIWQGLNDLHASLRFWRPMHNYLYQIPIKIKCMIFFRPCISYLSYLINLYMA